MNKIITILAFSSVSMALSMTATTVEAGIFKCVDANGKTYFVDKPCPVNNKETEFKAIKDPVNGYIPPAFAADKIKSKSKKTGVMEDADTEKVMGEQGGVSETASVGGSGNQSEIGQATNSESDVSSDRSESDIAFNKKLKNIPVTSSTEKGEGGIPLKNIFVLEPSG